MSALLAAFPRLVDAGVDGGLLEEIHDGTHAADMREDAARNLGRLEAALEALVRERLWTLAPASGLSASAPRPQCVRDAARAINDAARLAAQDGTHVQADAIKHAERLVAEGLVELRAEAAIAAACAPVLAEDAQELATRLERMGLHRDVRAIVAAHPETARRFARALELARDAEPEDMHVRHARTLVDGASDRRGAIRHACTTTGFAPLTPAHVTAAAARASGLVRDAMERSIHALVSSAARGAAGPKIAALRLRTAAEEAGLLEAARAALEAELEGLSERPPTRPRAARRAMATP